MTVPLLKPLNLPPEANLLPQHFDTAFVVIPPDNPPHNPATLADLVASMLKFGQRDPGWVYPSPDLPTEHHRYCAEGCTRLMGCIQLGMPFRAFDIGRPVSAEERIRMMFLHHATRRRWNGEVVAAKAGQYMELTGCTAAEAAKALGCSESTLCRAFGEKRIPPELRPRVELLGASVRALVAATPVLLMPAVLEFALAERSDGKRPSRDQVAAFIQQLKKQSNGQSKGRKPRTLTLRMNGRTVTLTVDDRDSSVSLMEDLKALLGKLNKHAEVPLDGLPFLFQQ